MLQSHLGHICIKTMALFALQEMLAPVTDGFKETTVLRRAVETGRVSQVLYLLQKGCDINGKSGSRGITPFISACFIKDASKRAKIVKLLLQYNADCSVGDINGQNVLFYACAYRLTDVLGLLLRSVDFDMNSQDLHGNTALHIAAMVMDMDVLKLLIRALLSYQLSLSVHNKLRLTPLLLALLVGNLAGALTLHAAGACPRLSCKDLQKITQLLKHLNCHPGDSIVSLLSFDSTTDSSILLEVDKPFTPSIKVHHATSTGSLISLESLSSEKLCVAVADQKSDRPALPFLMPQGTRVSTLSYKAKNYIKVTSDVLMMSQLLRQTCPSLQLSLGVFPMTRQSNSPLPKLPQLQPLCEAVSYDSLIDLVSVQHTRSYYPPSRLETIDQSWLQSVSSYSMKKNLNATLPGNLPAEPHPLMKRESSSSRLGSRVSLQSGKLRKKISVEN